MAFPEVDKSEKHRLAKLGIWLFLIVGIAGGLLTLLEVSYRKFHPESPAEIARRLVDDPSKLIKHIKVWNYEFDIPASYFKLRVPREDEDNVLYLEALLPGMRPLEQSAQDYWDEGHNDLLATALVYAPEKNGVRRKTVPEIAPSRIRSHLATEYAGETFGLRNYRSPKPLDGNDDVLIEGTIENAKTVITCEKETDRAVNKLCEMIFHYGELTVNFHFYRRWLPQWRQLQNDFVALLNSFETTNFSHPTEKGN